MSHSGLLCCMPCLTQTAPHNATENREITRNTASTTEDNPGGRGGGEGEFVALFPLIMLCMSLGGGTGATILGREKCCVSGTDSYDACDVTISAPSLYRHYATTTPPDNTVSYSFTRSDVVIPYKAIE